MSKRPAASVATVDEQTSKRAAIDAGHYTSNAVGASLVANESPHKANHNNINEQRTASIYFSAEELIPELPRDLSWIVFSYAPGVALCLPIKERGAFMHRLTDGLYLSDERACLVLEQLDAGNRDFDDPTLAGDNEAWLEALWYAYSPRALAYLVCHGHILSPPSLNQDTDLRSYIYRVVFSGKGDDAVAVLQELERASPDSDVLDLARLVEYAAHKPNVQAPMVRYLLRRLLDPNDPSFIIRKTYEQKCHTFQFARDFVADENLCPIGLLALQIYNGLPFDNSLECPLARAFLDAHPEARSLLLHLDVLSMMHHHSMKRKNLRLEALFPTARPSESFRFSWSDSSIQIKYGPFTREWPHDDLDELAFFCDWLVEDWLAHAQKASDWTGFVLLLQVVAPQERAVITLVEGVPPEVVARLMSEEPAAFLCTLMAQECTPPCLIKRVDFHVWLRAQKSMGREVCFTPKNNVSFNARERVLLHRAWIGDGSHK